MAKARFAFLALLALAMVAACSPENPSPPPTSVESSQPATAESEQPTRGTTPPATSAAGPTLPTSLNLTANQEKAAREALAAFDKYLRIRDLVLQDGGENPERLKEVATSAILEAESNDAGQFAHDHEHLTGESQYDSLNIVDISLEDSPPDNLPTVTLYVCVDVSKTDVLDENGRSALSGTRKTRWPSTYYTWRQPDTQKWLVGDLKQGEGTC